MQIVVVVMMIVVIVVVVILMMLLVLRRRLDRRLCHRPVDGGAKAVRSRLIHVHVMMMRVTIVAVVRH